MGIFGWITNIFDMTSITDSTSNELLTNDLTDINANEIATVNPANGLPMIEGIGGLDVAGNTFGSDSSISDSWINDSSNSLSNW